MSWTADDDTADDLSTQLEAAQERIKQLEAEVRYFEDRADRAERWVYKIWVEIEQKFFAGTLFVSRSHSLPRQSGYRSLISCAIGRSYPQGIDSGLVRWWNLLGPWLE
jgi:hypothetical protein